MKHVSLRELRPAGYNPRNISPEKRAALKKSYLRFGDLSGIIFNKKTGNLVGGHQRIAEFRAYPKARVEKIAFKDRFGTVAKGEVVIDTENGHLRIPYREVEWDGNTERAANITANTSAGEFDMPKVGAILRSLEKNKFAIEDIPFDTAEFRQAIVAFDKSRRDEGKDAVAGSEDFKASPAELAAIRKSWRPLIAEWDKQIQSIAKGNAPSTNITKAALGAQFVSALYKGTKIGRSATLPYTPHRLFVPGDKYPLSRLFRAALKNDSILDSIIWYAGNTTDMEKFIRGTMAIHGHRAPGDFPIDLAQSLIDEFCPKCGRVLDPCHGWGGRTVGFLLSKAQQYMGFDVDPTTSRGVKEMFQDLNDLLPKPKRAIYKLCPFEKSTLPANSFDFAFTSPPYFSTEKYNGENQSWKLYPTFEKWVKGFYYPLIAKTAMALKPSATFCLQVGSQSFPLAKTAKNLAPRCRLKYIETRSTTMVNNRNNTDIESMEVILVFRKDR